MKALILVDLQNDFCPDGALEVAEGDLLIPIANELMDAYDLVVATQDWHPADHGSFAANHDIWNRPYQVIDLHGLPQVLWPIHCVQNSYGALFHPDLKVNAVDKIFPKGTDKTVDSYSGFFDNGKRKATGMGAYLKDKNVTSVHIMGLATDYCVKFTALDAISLGFETSLLLDACRGVGLNEGDIAAAVEEMMTAGVDIIPSYKKCLRKDSV